MDLEQAQARIAELEGQVTSLTGERDGAVALGEQLRAQLGETAAARDAAAAQVTSLTGERDAAQRALSDASGALGEAQDGLLEATRRALLAENNGQVVPELIVGETPEALAASVETAKAAHARAADAARAALAGQTVPAGAGSARTTSGAEGLTPLELIASGLSGKGGA